MKQTVQENSKREKGYTVKTYGIDKGSINKFEKFFEKLRKRALNKGVKLPVKGDVVSRLFDGVEEFLPIDTFFKE